MLNRLLCHLFGHDWHFFHKKDIGIVWAHCLRCHAWHQEGSA